MTDQPSAESKGQNTYFATTHWTVVIAASEPSTALAHDALQELCRNYWYPLYAYIRRQGYGKEDAEDLTQAFFARFLSKNYLQGLSHEKGKFRAFLLASLKHFLANEWDRAHRQKRGGGTVPLSLDWHEADSQYQITPADHLSPDKLYDRAWAMTLLARVLARLREESKDNGKEKLFEVLKVFLTTGKTTISYSQASSVLGMTEAAVRVTVHRFRSRYRDLLRQEISQTLSDPEQVREEIRALFGAFAD